MMLFRLKMLLVILSFRSRFVYGERSNRVFTSRPLGENSMREQIGKCNLRIPLELQVENPTGHSGRKTFCSVAVNNNVSALVVAQATKHKDLMRYVSVSDNSLMEASSKYTIRSISR